MPDLSALLLTSTKKSTLTKAVVETIRVFNPIKPELCTEALQVVMPEDIRATDITIADTAIRNLIMYRPISSDLSFPDMTSGIVRNSTTFHGGTPVTRAEFVKTITRSLGCRYQKTGTSVNFDDISEGTWYIPYIAFALQNKWIDGYGDGVFHPDAPITHAEMAKILMRSLQLDTT
jgi:S-layer homology domain